MKEKVARGQKVITEIEIDLAERINKDNKREMFAGWKRCMGVECTKIVKPGRRFCKCCDKIRLGGNGDVKTSKFLGNPRRNCKSVDG